MLLYIIIVELKWNETSGFSLSAVWYLLLISRHNSHRLRTGRHIVCVINVLSVSCIQIPRIPSTWSHRTPFIISRHKNKTKKEWNKFVVIELDMSRVSLYIRVDDIFFPLGVRLNTYMYSRVGCRTSGEMLNSERGRLHHRLCVYVYIQVTLYNSFPAPERL
jgi:hypothetical protein